MKIIKRVLLTLVLLGIIYLFVALFAPKHLHVERSVHINAPVNQVFRMVNDLANWPAWSPWKEMDPKMKETYSDPSAGVGARAEWHGPKTGSGAQVITESVRNEHIRTELTFDREKGISYSDWYFSGNVDSTSVTWTFLAEDVPWLRRPLSWFAKNMLEEQYDIGLRKLKDVSEAMPRTELPEYVIVDLDRELHLLVQVDTIGRDGVRGPATLMIEAVKFQCDLADIEPVAAPVVVFKEEFPARFLVAAGYPLATPMRHPPPGFEVYSMKAQRVLTFTVTGPVEAVPAALDALRAHALGEGYRITGPMWAALFVAPGIETDPEKELTQLYCPIE